MHVRLSFVAAALLIVFLPQPAFSAPLLPAASIVIPRSGWGADESLLFQEQMETPEEQPSQGNGGTATTPQNRVDDCVLAQQNYPAQFSASAPVRQDAAGRKYRWALTYSNKVELLVVHHTAITVTGDTRSGAEKVRALYKYHANSRGWGDVGYHYLIDEEGKIYEGRQGGKGVVGGHAYCNNVGTVGIALLGNFDLEAPTALQTKALQKLLIRLGDEYDIDLTKPTTFHGKQFVSPIVGHDDLVSTGCPGYYLDEAFGQVIRNSQAGNADAVVKYAVLPKVTTPKPKSAVPQSPISPGISYLGSRTISINPGGNARLNILYTAPDGGGYEGKNVAPVTLGHTDLELFTTGRQGRAAVRSGLLLPSDVPAGEAITFQLLVTAPRAAGVYWMEIGGVRFTINVTGRRARTDVDTSRFGSASSSAATVQPTTPRVRPVTRRTSQSSSPSSAPRITAQSRALRIKLSSTPVPTITFPSAGTVDGKIITAGSRIEFTMNGTQLQAKKNGSVIVTSPILRFAADQNGLVTIDSVRGANRSYRGIIEARVLDGKIVLINELPLETYLRGLSEEPDTEPYEKQRAFAIAARTYALYYMDNANRKFPNMPFDGSDDPAIFQSYSGAGFESANPSWLRAVTSTNKQVLTFRGSIIKPPYFSSDDGRTRSAAEAGWSTFPFAEIFVSKPDPWCAGMENRGHGVGMSGCGAEGQANEGKTAEQILQYYYPGTVIR